MVHRHWDDEPEPLTHLLLLLLVLIVILVF
jgi:hypothetical protein